MAKRFLDVPSTGRLAELDLVSYGRRGRHTPLQFSSAQLEQIGRTIRGVPEVMVKVSGGGKSADAAQAHFAYSLLCLSSNHVRLRNSIAS